MVVTLAFLFALWAVAAAILCAMNYPNYRARNDICAAARRAAGVLDPAAPPQIRAQAVAGLRALAEAWNTGRSWPPCPTSAVEAIDTAPGAPCVAEAASGSGYGAQARKGGSPHPPRIRMEQFIWLVAQEVARRHPRQRWWHPLTLLDYAKRVPTQPAPESAGASVGGGCTAVGGSETLAAALVRGAVHESYRAVEALVDGWQPPRSSTELLAEEMTEVISCNMEVQYLQPHSRAAAARD